MTVRDTLTAFSSAGDMLRAMRRRQISAVELLEAHIRRCETLDSDLNSIVVRDFDRARNAAARADERRAAGEDPPLLGLPVTVKESVDIEGLPSTAGVVSRVGHRAAADAASVARMRAAGAVIFGKTNVCTWLADYQADNPVYGQTRNPWDRSRTSGGSSGGSATLAAGLTPLDWGSDLGGSIRVPAAFCGLWGHKPTQDIVPNTGHFPGSQYPNTALPLAVQGPHARSVDDLELALDVVAGPRDEMKQAWSLRLPPTRAKTLSHFRVAALPPVPWLAVDSEILAAMEEVLSQLRKAGCAVTEARPPELGDCRNYYAMFRSMMAVTVSARWPRDKREQAATEKRARGETFHAADADGFCATAGELVGWHEQREIYAASWRDFYNAFDVLLTPITLTAAFEHTTVPNADRRLCVNGSPVEFEYMSFYPGLATLTGQPATVIPIGSNTAGLPLGLQVIGPQLGDRTTLHFARLLEQEFHGFQPPPGYDDRIC